MSGMMVAPPSELRELRVQVTIVGGVEGEAFSFQGLPQDKHKFQLVSISNKL